MFKSNWNSFKNLFKAFTIENIQTIIFVLGAFVAFVGLVWLLVLFVIWTFGISLPLGLLTAGVVTALATYGTSFFTN